TPRRRWRPPTGRGRPRPGRPGTPARSSCPSTARRRGADGRSPPGRGARWTRPSASGAAWVPLTLGAHLFPPPFPPTAWTCSRAVSRSSACTSGFGRSSESARLLSLSQKMPRLSGTTLAHPLLRGAFEKVEAGPALGASGQRGGQLAGAVGVHVLREAG